MQLWRRVASAVVSRLSGKQEKGQDEVRIQIQQLTSEIVALRQELADAGVVKPRTPSTLPEQTSTSTPVAAQGPGS